MNKRDKVRIRKTADLMEKILKDPNTPFEGIVVKACTTSALMPVIPHLDQIVEKTDNMTIWRHQFPEVITLIRDYLEANPKAIGLGGEEY